MKELISLREIKRRSSRLDMDFYILKNPEMPKSTRTDAAFSYYGPNVWNKLPYYLRCLSDLDKFKKGLKSYYFDMAFEGM